MELCPKPRDLTLYRQKHDKIKAVQKVLPMSSSPASALGLASAYFLEVKRMELFVHVV